MSSVLQIVLTLSVLSSALLILSHPFHTLLYAARQRKRTRSIYYHPSVSILVPVKGIDEGALENFESYFGQTYPGRFEIVFCLESEDDPAVPIIRHVIAHHPEIAAQLILSGDSHDKVGKMHNLAAALVYARHEVVVMVDSDVRFVNHSVLRELILPLSDQKVGLVTCYQACYDSRNIPAALIALTINSDLPGYFSLLAVYGKLDLANGATMAIRREVLDASGGVSHLGRRLLNDTALARQVRSTGRKVVLAPFPAHVNMGKSTPVAWWRQTHRWHVAVHSYLPFARYLIFGLSRVGLFAALLFALAVPANSTGWFLVFFAIACRTTSLAILNMTVIEDSATWKYFPLALVLDLLSPLFWILPFFWTHVHWRGRRYRVYRKGEAVLLK